MKNILLFHLESVSNLIFRTNPECFPSLIKFLDEAEYFPNYYSSATSTYMVITDLFFGDSLQFEKSNYLEDIFSIKPTKQSIFDKLAEIGYKTKCYCYGVKAGEKARKHVEVYCSKAECWESASDLDSMIDDLYSNFKMSNRFAYFIQDLESHWMNIDTFSDGRKSSCELFKIKYQMLDRTFGLVINALKNSGKYEDTMIIIYGDHGDDFWGHGLHDGYTHAIEPYPFLVNCPLIVKNGPVLNKHSLLSTVDLFKIMMSEVHGGHDEFQNECVFSRNLFSGQKISESSFNKSYLATDGNYSLLVSSKGVKLFCNNLDVANGKNMLDFFNLLDGEIFYNKRYNHLRSSHYKLFMTDLQILEFQRVFKDLYKNLQNYVEIIYGSNDSEMNFNEIDYTSEGYRECGLGQRLFIRNFLFNIKAFIKMLIGYKNS